MPLASYAALLSGERRSLSPYRRLAITRWANVHTVSPR
jgi:hypothetical protein